MPERVDEEMELLPEPPVPSASSASSPDMARFVNVAVLSEDSVQDFCVPRVRRRGRLCLSRPACLRVTLPAPSTEQEWKAIVKNPKRFVAKSVQKRVEVSYAKLNPTTGCDGFGQSSWGRELASYRGRPSRKEVCASERIAENEMGH